MVVMGRLGDFARRAMNWQKDQSLADAINEDTEKKKKRIRETRDKIAAKMAPDNVLMKGRRGMIQAGATEEEMSKMGFGKELTGD
jgi:hypothetical protein